MIHLAMMGVDHIHVADYVGFLSKRDDVSIKRVWSQGNKKEEFYGKKLNAIVTTDLDDVMTDAAIDGVIVCGRTSAHQKVISSALRAGKAIFVEKPLAKTVEASEAIAKEIQAAGVAFHIGFFWREQLTFCVLRKAIKEGFFGKITHANASFSHGGLLDGWFDNEYKWMIDPQQSGPGFFADLGIHLVDLFTWFFGDIATVIAQTDSRINRGEKFDQFGCGMIQFKNGVIGTIQASGVNFSNPTPLIIHGTEGSAYIYKNSLVVEGDAANRFDWQELPEIRLASEDSLAGFIEQLKGNRAMTITPNEAAQCSSIIDAMYRSIASQSWELVTTSSENNIHDGEN